MRGRRGVVAALAACMALNAGALETAAPMDQVRRDVFEIGYQLGKACYGAAYDGYWPNQYPGVLDWARYELANAAQVAYQHAAPGPLGDAYTELYRLVYEEIEALSFSQIDARVNSVTQQFQQAFSATVSPVASGLLAIGVWVGGAECVARLHVSARREDRPGAGDLVMRNLGWLQGEVGNPVYGLSAAPVAALMGRVVGGIPFETIMQDVGPLHGTWERELQAAPPFGQARIGVMGGAEAEAEEGSDPPPANACDVACASYCRSVGSSGGVLRPNYVCLMGEIQGSLREACQCR